MAPGPRIEFSEWIPWTRRGELQIRDSAGVYLLAHFKRGAPGGPADPEAAEIVYVGVTGKTPGRTTLARRWRAFERSASSGRLAHSGGSSYFREFSGVRSDLYVAAFAPPASMDDLRAPVFVRYVERLVLWRYVARHGRRPACNAE